MLRIFPVVALSLMLGGCALPLPLQVASWVVDGIVYINTDKSVTDHGISAVTGQDCALLRTVQGEAVCHTAEEGVMMAMADQEEVDFRTLTDDTGNTLPLAFEQEGAAPLGATDLAEFVTAAGQDKDVATPVAFEQWDENFARTLEFSYVAPSRPDQVVEVNEEPLEMSALPLSFEQDGGVYIPVVEEVALLINPDEPVQLAWDYVDATKGVVR